MHIGINGSNKVEVGEAGNHSGFYIGPTVLNREIYYSILVYHALNALCSHLELSEARDIPSDKARSEKEIIDHYVSHLPECLKEIIKDPSSESSTIVRFCHPIIEKLSVLAKNYDIKIIKNFQLENLKEKLWFLKELKSKNSFAAMQKAYRDKWGFYGLMNDVDFKQTYVNKAVGELDEPAGKSFREGINKYVKLVEEGREIASKYFGKASFQAYCEETGNADKTLNINLINYSGSEPIKISDILQQEESIDKLNIYCNKRHDICAHRKDQKRYYEFKEGAWYQMISEWPIKDKSGRGISRCTMVMNVGSDGIAEIVEFIGKGSNGENYILSLEQDQAYCMELIKQNKELYIQNVLLCNAVEEFLRMQHRGSDSLLPDVVPQNKDNIGSNPTDSSGISEVCGEQLKPNHGDNVGGTPTLTSSGESRVPTEVNLKGKETQTETDLQIQSDHKLCKELDEIRKEISGLVQSSEELKTEVNTNRTKIESLESKLEKQLHRQ